MDTVAASSDLDQAPVGTPAPPTAMSGPEARPPFPDRFALLCRRVHLLLYGYLGLSLLLVGLAVLRRHDLDQVVWYRVGGVALSAVLYLVFANRMAAGRRWAYLRLRVLSVIGSLGILLLITMPGPFPGWMRIEQAVQAVVLVLLAVTLARPAITRRFRKPRR